MLPFSSLSPSSPVSPGSPDSVLTPEILDLPASRFPSFRRHQASTIYKLAASDKRATILCAPTGSGKSLTGFSLARLLDCRTLILTATKPLTAQWQRDFEDCGLASIEGHSNYSCARRSKSHIDPSMIDFECEVPRDECEYRAYVEWCGSKEVVTTNYAHWIQLEKSEDPLRLGSFDLLICDEAHALLPASHDLIAKQLSIEISRRYVHYLLDIRLPPAATDESRLIGVWQQWAGEARSIARERYRTLKKQNDNRNRSDRGPSRLSHEMIKLERFGKDLSRFLADSARDPWIVQTTDYGVKLTPVWCSAYTERYLFRRIPRIVLMSATISEADRDYLGLTAASCDYLEVESTFAPRRRPLIYVPTVKVDHNITDGETRQLVARIDKTIASRLDRKGIIHSRSYRWADIVFERSKQSDVMLTHTSKTTQEVVHRYMEASPPSVLVSPSVTEGFDFKGDLCRYQILLKVPYSDSRDPLVAARLAADRMFRYYSAAKSIMQAVGRPMREESDWGESLIFDLHFGYFRRMHRLFPLYFRKAWRQSDQVPMPLTIA